MRDNLTPPKHQTFPAIIMVGTAPIFYKIEVSKKLLDCLNKGTYPSEETKVLKYVPPVPDFAEYLSSGMRPLETRYVVFQCFEAFKSLCDSLILVISKFKHTYCHAILKDNLYSLKLGLALRAGHRKQFAPCHQGQT